MRTHDVNTRVDTERGEVLDEHDRRRAGIVRGDNSLTLPGDLRPDEVLDRTGIRIPEGDVYDTVGGYIMSVLERIPVVVAVPVVLDPRVAGDGLVQEALDGLLQRMRAAGATVYPPETFRALIDPHGSGPRPPRCGS